MYILMSRSLALHFSLRIFETSFFSTRGLQVT